MNQNLIAVFILVVSIPFFLKPLYAVELEPATPVPAADDAVAIPEDETEFSFGTVKSITGDQLVVSEYDYESNADVDVTYQVPAETEFENAASLKEIAVGDSVDIDFLVKDGQKKAVAITVEKPLTEDEELALTVEEEQPAAE